jgi:hypothetical protein
MGKSCTVCVHPDHSAIDTALKAGHPLRHVAATYGVSKTALHRHSQAHVFERQPPQSPPAQSPTTQHGFLSRVKTIAKWVVAIGVGVGYVWLAATAPRPTSGAQGAQSVPRV